MKTLLQSRNTFVFSLIFLFVASLSFAQVQLKEYNIQDHLFPQKGKSMFMIGTGIPYIGIAEYSYGISDRFSIGLMAGTTPIVPGYGIRIKSILFQKKANFRVFFKAPILYYPETKGLGGEPWALSWPSLNAEWRYDSGIRFSVGFGVVVAACVDALLGKEHIEPLAVDDHHHHHESHHVDHHIEEGGFMGNSWNTVQAGLAIPISKKIMFQTELAAVLDGTKIANDEWIGKVPFILFLGVSYSF